MVYVSGRIDPRKTRFSLTDNREFYMITSGKLNTESPLDFDILIVNRQSFKSREAKSVPQAGALPKHVRDGPCRAYGEHEVGSAPFLRGWLVREDE
jgi:hypothetical protein